MERNSISIGKLGDNSCFSTFKNHGGISLKGALVIEKQYRIGALYLCPHNNDFSIYVASTETGATLWHHSLGHMNEKVMQILHSRKLLPDLKQVSLEFYENRVYGKQKRVRFLRVGKQKKSEKLDFVHIDVWGPAQVQSLGGSRYYVTFIDDATRKNWVYCIR